VKNGFVDFELRPSVRAKLLMAFLVIEVLRDTPEVLKEYAQAFGANLAGRSFLTGEPAAVREVARRYGVFAAKAPNGNVGHTFLTSIIDQRGVLRVQYLGLRFDPEEFWRDLLSLLQE
jgi:protein SCO1